MQDLRLALNLIEALLPEPPEVAMRELETFGPRLTDKPLNMLTLAKAQPQELIDLFYSGLAKSPQETKTLFHCFVQLLNNPTTLKDLWLTSKKLQPSDQQACFNFYLSPDFIQRLQNYEPVFPEVATDLKLLLANRIPTQPSPWMPCLIVYSLTNQLFRIKAPSISYSKDLNGFVLRACYWKPALYRSQQGKAFLKTLRKLAKEDSDVEA